MVSYDMLFDICFSPVQVRWKQEKSRPSYSLRQHFISEKNKQSIIEDRFEHRKSSFWTTIFILRSSCHVSLWWDRLQQCWWRTGERRGCQWGAWPRVSSSSKTAGPVHWTSGGGFQLKPANFKQDKGLFHLGALHERTFFKIPFPNLCKLSSAPRPNVGVFWCSLQNIVNFVNLET